MSKSRLKVAREIFEAHLNGKTSLEGLAISGCRAKETMVLVRYGGDIIMAFFNNETKERVFEFVVEMTENRAYYWNEIFWRFVEIKSKLMQRIPEKKEVSD